MTEPSQLKKTFGPFEWALGILGAIGSVSAAISLVQHWGDIKLAEIPAQYVTYYRLLLRSLLDWIPFPWQWKIPQWYLDSLALNGIVAGAAVQSIDRVEYPQARHFAIAIWVSTVFPMGWLVGAALVAWLTRFSGSSIRDARERIQKWTAERDRRELTHPGKPIPEVIKEIQDNEEILRRHLHFHRVQWAFIIGLALVVFATLVFFTLNSLAPPLAAQ